MSARKVLIIDDEPDTVTFLGTWLEDQGFETRSATDGVQGMRMILEERPDLILMDLKMPVMDGMTAIRVLRGMNPHLKIIATTGSVRSQQEIQTPATRTDGFLRKPYTTARLLSVLNEVIKSN